MAGKITQTYTYDFGRGPFTVEDFLEFANQAQNLPPAAKLHISHGSAQLDGEWLKITITLA